MGIWTSQRFTTTDEIVRQIQQLRPVIRANQDGLRWVGDKIQLFDLNAIRYFANGVNA
jgi:hypothetical protein